MTKLPLLYNTHDSLIHWSHLSGTADDRSPLCLTRGKLAVTLAMSKPISNRLGQFVTGAALLTIPAVIQAAQSTGPKLSFEKNLGQTHESVDFTARGRRYAVTLHAGSYALALRTNRGGEPQTPKWMLRPWERFSSPTKVPWVVSMHLEGADNEAQAEGRELLAARSHYLRGRDKSGWLRDVPHYGRVRYGDVYPGIDIEYYGSTGTIEFDLIVAPGADPQQVRMQFDGAQEIEVDEEGDLVLRSGERELRHRRSISYQRIDGEKVDVAGSYVLKGDETVRFRLSKYDTSRPLVIDPLIQWQATIGGSGDDQFNAVDIGPDGFVYAVGTTESADLPTLAAFQDTPGGGPSDALVVQLRPDGTPVFITYLGGSGNEDAYDLDVDELGFICVAGTSSSTDFPTTDGVYQPDFAGVADAFVAKLAPDGSALEFATFLGSPALELGMGIAMDDENGDIFVTGITFAGSFPTTQRGFQSNSGGGADAFLSKLDSTGSRLLASTFFGGASLDGAQDIALNDQGPAITGVTESSNLPVTENAYQSTLGGGVDAFAVQFSPGLDQRRYATYLGGSALDDPRGVALDPFNNIWIGGGTRSSEDFPTTSNAPEPDFLGGSHDGFLARLPLPSDDPAIGLSPEALAQGTGGVGDFLNNFRQPNVTHTGDENLNFVFDIDLFIAGGRLFVLSSESNFTGELSPIRVLV